MPVLDPAEAKDLDQAIENLVQAASATERERCLREIFVGKLDFAPETGTVDLRGEKAPVDHAVRIAVGEGVRVVWTPVQNPRVLLGESRSLSRALATRLGDDHLLVHSNADGSAWHFVYPTASGGKTVLRRMVVERGLPRRTVVMQLAKIYHDARTSDVRAALEHAYDVEPVTTEFFHTYREVFESVLAMIQGVPDPEQRRLFCQTLFNRLMFIYFLQRKGWLRINGSKDYLSALWEAYRASDETNFHHFRLKLLFFQGLNNPDSRDLTDGFSPAIGFVPFLNGGLFEETELDRSCADAIVPDLAFDLILNRLFRRFNFTVSESTPYDIEVAVDPEMLGKVFEELVTGRHESGSYYTPRPVVSFMCREALKGYLTSTLPGVPTTAIAEFVDAHDVSALDLLSAERIMAHLRAVRVVDPACGSGAYLVGMLHELVNLHQTIYSERLDSSALSLYNTKLQIIQESLHGADFDEFAVNIAMLRLWLSLIVEFDGPRPPALPNLTFKIVVGDSLTAPDPQLTADLFRPAIHLAALEVASAKKDYVASFGARKDELKGHIELTESQLRHALGAAPAPAGSVDWRVDFAEVFDEKGGFDIVLANPPYVRQELIGDTKDQLIALYRDSASGKSDLYVYFYHRGLELLREGGMHVFVCSNSWLDAEYGGKLQLFLLNNANILAVLESEDEKQFATAEINTLISILQKKRQALPQPVRFVLLKGAFEESVREFSAQVNNTGVRIRSVPSDTLKSLTRGGKRSGKWGGRFLRAPEAFDQVSDKMKSVLRPFESLADLRYGLKTGATKTLVTDQYQDPGQGASLIPFLTSLKLCKSRYVDPAWLPFLIDVRDRDAAADWIKLRLLLAEKEGVADRPSLQSSSNHAWYQVADQEPASLICPQFFDKRLFICSAPKNVHYSNTFWGIYPQSQRLNDWLFAVLNSSFALLQFELLGRVNLGGGVLTCYGPDIAEVMLPAEGPAVSGIPGEIFPVGTQEWHQAQEQIDRETLGAFGIDEELRQGLREALAERVSKRVGRATGLTRG